MQSKGTWCSLNIVFCFKHFRIYIPEFGLSLFPRCQCVYTGLYAWTAAPECRTPALQRNSQSSQKSQHFKSTIIIMYAFPPPLNYLLWLFLVRSPLEICSFRPLQARTQENSSKLYALVFFICGTSM